MGQSTWGQSVAIILRKSSLIMKIMGFYSVLALCLLSSSTLAAPSPVLGLPFADPFTTGGLTAGALTLTTPSGAITSVPLAALLAGKVLVVKGALIANAIKNRDQ